MSEMGTEAAAVGPAEAYVLRGLRNYDKGRDVVLCELLHYLAQQVDALTALQGCEVAVLRPEPDDTLVLRCDREINEVQRLRLDREARRIFPHARVAILDPGMTLEVVKQETNSTDKGIESK